MINYWLEIKGNIEEKDFINIEGIKYSMLSLFQLEEYQAYKYNTNLLKTNISLDQSFKEKKIEIYDEIEDFSFISLFVFEVFYNFTKNKKDKKLEEYLRNLLKIKDLKYNIYSKKINNYQIPRLENEVFLFIDKDKHSKFEDFYFPILNEIVTKYKGKGITFKELDNENLNLKSFVEYLAKKCQKHYMKTHIYNTGRIDEEILLRTFRITLSHDDYIISFFKENRKFDFKYQKELDKLNKLEEYDCWFDSEENIEYTQEKKKISLKYLEEIKFTLNEEEKIEYIDRYGCTFDVLDLIRIKTIRMVKEKIKQKDNIMEYVLSPTNNDFIREVNNTQIETLLEKCSSTNIQKLIKANRNVLDTENILSMLNKIKEVMEEKKVKPTDTLVKYYYDFINSRIKTQQYLLYLTNDFTKYLFTHKETNKNIFITKYVEVNLFKLLNAYIFGGKQPKKVRQKLISNYLFKEKRDRGLDFKKYIFELFETEFEEQMKVYYFNYMLNRQEWDKEKEIEVYETFISTYKKEIEIILKDLKERVSEDIIVF